ncbi:hypothetical protein OS11_19660 [Dickeya oryzae]
MAKKNLSEIVSEIGNLKSEDVTKLIEFLLNQHLIFNVAHPIHDDLRFSRQITFWDDFVLDRPGQETQAILENKKNRFIRLWCCRCKNYRDSCSCRRQSHHADRLQNHV